MAARLPTTWTMDAAAKASKRVNVRAARRKQRTTQAVSPVRLIRAKTGGRNRLFAVFDNQKQILLKRSPGLPYMKASVPMVDALKWGSIVIRFCAYQRKVT